jgi:hypothetical protein
VDFLSRHFACFAIKSEFGEKHDGWVSIPQFVNLPPELVLRNSARA